MPVEGVLSLPSETSLNWTQTLSRENIIIQTVHYNSWGRKSKQVKVTGHSNKFFFCRITPISTRRFFLFITWTFKRQSLKLFRFKRSCSVSFMRHLFVFNVQPVKGTAFITYCTLFVLFDVRRNYLFVERKYFICADNLTLKTQGGCGVSDFSETLQYKIT